MKYVALVKKIPALTLFGLTACTNINPEEMHQLGADEARAAIMGKTQTLNTEYGKWAQYTQPDQLAGVGRASGSWGDQKVTATHTISDTGEVCSEYLADYKWSAGPHQFCSIYFKNLEGAIFSKATRDTNKPERVGQIIHIAITEGDTYNLMN